MRFLLCRKDGSISIPQNVILLVSIFVLGLPYYISMFLLASFWTTYIPLFRYEINALYIRCRDKYKYYYLYKYMIMILYKNVYGVYILNKYVWC